MYNSEYPTFTVQQADPGKDIIKKAKGQEIQDFPTFYHKLTVI